MNKRNEYVLLSDLKNDSAFKINFEKCFFLLKQHSQKGKIYSMFVTGDYHFAIVHSAIDCYVSFKLRRSFLKFTSAKRDVCRNS